VHDLVNYVTRVVARWLATSFSEAWAHRGRSRRAPKLDTAQVADLLQVVRARVLRHLSRTGVVEVADELYVLGDDFAEREPALAALARAAVSGMLPAGPERRSRPPLGLAGRPGVEIAAPLSVMELGFSLHAATTASGNDASAKEALVRYILRPPIAQERLTLLSDELVRIELRRPFRDGTVAIDLDPLSLLCRLAASVPPPKVHLVRYAGVLGAASKLRAQVVPPLLPSTAGVDVDATQNGAAPERPPAHRSRYRPWAELLKRSFAADVETCERCVRA
jgi:hypothetical protein